MWTTSIPLPSSHNGRQVRIVTSGEHGHPMATSSKVLGQRGDVDVLAACVDVAEYRQRAGVLGDKRDPPRPSHHRVTSTIVASQSFKKRSRP